jgi:hypothetical protein
MHQCAEVPAGPTVVGIAEMYACEGILGRVALDNPGVATICTLDDIPIASYHPARPAIQEENIVEESAYGHIQALPGGSAVGGSIPDAAATAVPAHDDCGLRVKYSNPLEVLCVRVKLLLPGHASVAGVVDTGLEKARFITYRPALQAIGHVYAA